MEAEGLLVEAVLILLCTSPSRQIVRIRLRIVRIRDTLIPCTGTPTVCIFMPMPFTIRPDLGERVRLCSVPNLRCIMTPRLNNDRKQNHDTDADNAEPVSGFSFFEVRCLDSA